MGKAVSRPGDDVEFAAILGSDRYLLSDLMEGSQLRLRKQIKRWLSTSSSYQKYGGQLVSQRRRCNRWIYDQGDAIDGSSDQGDAVNGSGDQETK